MRRSIARILRRQRRHPLDQLGISTAGEQARRAERPCSRPYPTCFAADSILPSPFVHIEKRKGMLRYAIGVLFMLLELTPLNRTRGGLQLSSDVFPW